MRTPSARSVVFVLLGFLVVFVGTGLALTSSNLPPFSSFLLPETELPSDSVLLPPAMSVDGDASVSTDKHDYQPGETVYISGRGFAPNEHVTLQIVHWDPVAKNVEVGIADHQGHDPWTVNADDEGRVTSSWLVQEDSKNRILLLTADGQTSQLHAEMTFTDGGSMGADKAMYRLDSAVWTSGNAGSTVEGKWISYMYVLDNIDPNEPLPAFSITYPIFIAANDAMYFDGASNFRFCIDQPGNTCSPVGGGTPGTIPDGTARPPSSTMTGWTPYVPSVVNAPYGTCIDPVNPIATGTPGVTAPCELRYFRVTPGSGSVPTTIGTRTRITFFFELHLAQTPLWMNSLEANFEPMEMNAILTDPMANPLNQTYGYNLYNLWTNPFGGAGPASVGSSQHVNITDFQANGTQNTPGGALTLPIPTVAPALSHVVSGQKFNDLNGNGVKDNGEPGLQGWTITLAGTLEGGGALSFPTMTDANGNYTFSNVFPGTYTIVETPQSGWTQTAPNLTNVNQLPNGTANPVGLTHSANSGTYNLCIETDPASGFCTSTTASPSTLGNIDFGNQQPFGAIKIVKITEGGDDTFPFTPTGFNSGTSFNLTTVSGMDMRTFSNINSNGTYSISENPPTGWDQVSASCNNGTPASITVLPGQTTTCTFTNRKRGTVVINKVTQGGDDTFAYTGTGTGISANFNITTSSGSGSQTFSNIVSGAKSVTEGTLPTGWDFVSLSCTDPDNGTNVSGQTANIDLDPGETVTCTYTNRKRGSIKIVKVTEGGDGTFQFNPTGFNGGTSFNLTTPGSAMQTFSNITPGNGYAITETNQTGWDLISFNCDNGSTTAIVVTAGQTTTCTATNRKRGSIKIVKVTQGGDGTFQFNPAGFNSNNSFNLTTPNSAMQTFENIVPGGTYSINESSQTGWDLLTFTCDNGSTSAITVAAGQTTTCTATNRKRGAIKIIKVTQGGDGTFQFNPTGFNSNNSFNLMTSSGMAMQLFDNLIPGGSYLINESSQTGWDLVSFNCDNGSASSIVVAAGQTTTCTATNRKRGAIKIVKNTVGGDGTFQFNPTGFNSNNSFNLMTSSGMAMQLFDNLPPGGSYSITETGQTGWDLVTFTCDNGMTSAIVVTAGQTTTCTATNRKKGAIKIVKNTVGGDGTFQFNPTGFNSNNSFNLMTSSGMAMQQFDNITPGGTYSITETGQTGWDLTSFTCNNGTTTGITVVAGQTTTCTATNTKRGSITINKVAVGGNGTFGYTGSGGAPVGNFNIATVGGMGTQQFDNVPPGGPYTIVENTPPSGWNFTSLECGAGGTVTLMTRTATINVQPGANVTCTYTNTKQATVKVVKNTTGGDASFDFMAGGTLVGAGSPMVPSTVTVSTSSGMGMSSTFTFSNLPSAGSSLTFNEVVPAGWSFDSVGVMGDSQAGTVGTLATLNVNPGETITVTYANIKKAKVIVKKVMVGGTSTFNFTGTPSGAVSTNNGTIMAEVVPATYMSTEGSATGWDLNSVSCDDNDSTGDVGSRTATFRAAAGETITCTFTNTKRGNIIVRKATLPAGSQQSFEFDPSYSDLNFLLTDGGANDSGQLVPGPYSVGEVNIPSGWDLFSATCDNGNDPSSITLAAGQTVTCTFTNKQRGSVIINKTSVGGDATFAYTGSGSGISANFNISTSSGSGSQTFSNIAAGSKTVTESGPPTGWDLTSLSCMDPDGGTTVNGATATIDLDPGETVSCTYTNRKRGSIKVVKTSVGGNGTFTYMSNFGVSSIATTGGSVQTPGMGMQLVENLVPGSGYAISESDQADWYEGVFACDHTDQSGIVVLPGQLTTCMITNVKIPKLIVQKIVQTPEPNINSASFTMHVNSQDGNPSPTQFAGSASGTSVLFDIDGGSYNVTEDIPQGAGPYLTNYSTDCTGSVAPGEVKTCTVTNIYVTGFVTSSELCTFDIDPNKMGAQFRLLFTPDNSLSVYKQNASNPGQFYYNVLHYNDPMNPNDNSVTMNIPYPFVTHGATPVHVYSSVTIKMVGGQACLVPGTGVGSQTDQITLASYGSNPTMGVTTKSITVDVPEGFSYVNVHLDYGLKQTTGYAKQVLNGMNNAIQTIAGSGPDILDMQTYTFSNGGVHVVQSVNDFKRNPGVGGLFRIGDDIAVPGQTVDLLNSLGVSVAPPGTSDEDGWYFINYKHTGKQQLYTVVWRQTGQTKTVLLKANGLAQVDFP